MNKVIKYTLLFFLLFSFNNSFSQKNKKDSKNESSLYSGLKFRSVGPAFMSGRIAEIAINPENENEWYVAVGSGGAWKTVNAGTTWEPLTDNQSFIQQEVLQLIQIILVLFGWVQVRMLVEDMWV